MKNGLLGVFGLLLCLSGCVTRSTIREIKGDLLRLMDCEKSCQGSCEAAKHYLMENVK